MTLSNFQNSWPENLSVLRIKSIEKLSIFELMWYWYLLLPKRRMFTKSLSVALISLSFDLILFMRVCLCNEKWWQCRKKWTLFSTLKLHEQSGLIQSLKLWLNLWSLRWLKPNRRWVNNFKIVGLWIPYVLLNLGLIKFNILFLNIKYDSDDFMILPKLFNSFTVYGKKRIPKKFGSNFKIWKRWKTSCITCCRDGFGIWSFKYWGKPLDYILKK